MKKYALLFDENNATHAKIMDIFKHNQRKTTEIVVKALVWYFSNLPNKQETMQSELKFAMVDTSAYYDLLVHRAKKANVKTARTEKNSTSKKSNVETVKPEIENEPDTETVKQIDVEEQAEKHRADTANQLNEILSNIEESNDEEIAEIGDNETASSDYLKGMLEFMNL